MKRNDLAILLLVIFFIVLFFYKLGIATLVSWDEAWYGSIAREIIRSGDFFKLNWNGKPFYDHPPLVMWLMAISYKLFGINELATRIPSALAGLASITLIYKIAIYFFGKKSIGLMAGIILGTSVWYLIRVRSGNLDAIFCFFYLLTIFFSLKVVKDFRWFIAVGISLACLILSKTLVGFSIIPLLLFINFNQIKNFRKNYRSIIAGIVFFILIAGSWYFVNLTSYPDFFKHHFLYIGTRDKTILSFFQIKPSLPFFYLHMGIRKWYYLWLMSALYLIFSLKFLKKNFFFILLWNLIVLYPFLTSDKTEIWHLIPVYLPISLVTSTGIYFLGFDIADKLKIKKQLFPSMSNFVYIAFIVSVALIQIKNLYQEVYPVSKYIPDDVAISIIAGKYKTQTILDDDFLPIAVFYSGKKITPLNSLSDDRQTLVKLFKSGAKNYNVIARNWAVEGLKQAGVAYKLSAKNNSFSIISK